MRADWANILIAHLETCLLNSIEGMVVHTTAHWTHSLVSLGQPSLQPSSLGYFRKWRSDQIFSDTALSVEKRRCLVRRCV